MYKLYTIPKYRRISIIANYTGTTDTVCAINQYDKVRFISFTQLKEYSSDLRNYSMLWLTFLLAEVS